MQTEKKNANSLTQEEVRTLEGMQNTLKDFYNSAVARKKIGTYERRTAIHTAAEGYAVITDILSRNR